MNICIDNSIKQLLKTYKTLLAGLMHGNIYNIEARQIPHDIT